MLEQVRAQTGGAGAARAPIPGVTGKRWLCRRLLTADEYTFCHRVVSLDRSDAPLTMRSSSRNPSSRPSCGCARGRDRHTRRLSNAMSASLTPGGYCRIPSLLAHGAPLVRDGVVESGNGRVMSMRA